MSPKPAAESLELAKSHLERVLDSWDPPDWLPLASFGLYALEAGVVAAAGHLGLSLQRNHWSKANAARELAANHSLPDIADLMQSLNEIRKSEAYGDVANPPSLDAEDVAREVEEFVEAVDRLFQNGAASGK